MTISTMLKMIKDLTYEITDTIEHDVCEFNLPLFESYLDETECQLNTIRSLLGLTEPEEHTQKLSDDDIPDLVEHIGTPAMLEQTAEECAELSKAALKMAREMRGENATHKKFEDMLANLQEEIADVSACIYHLIMHTDLCPEDEIVRIFNEKTERCRKRLAEEDKKREAKARKNITKMVLRPTCSDYNRTIECNLDKINMTIKEDN